MKWLAYLLILLMGGCSLGNITNSPDQFDVHYKVGNSDLGVGGDFNDSLLAPRIDAKTGETYFWLKYEYSCHPGSVFLESFQGANAVVKAQTWPLPDYIWDGVWLRPGARFQKDNWSFDAGPVYYMLSNERRPNHWGALFSWRLDF